jgi:hypothetical protein
LGALHDDKASANNNSAYARPVLTVMSSILPRHRGAGTKYPKKGGEPAFSAIASLSCTMYARTVDCGNRWANRAGLPVAMHHDETTDR